jgi:hypothetical protein
VVIPDDVEGGKGWVEALENVLTGHKTMAANDQNVQTGQNGAEEMYPQQEEALSELSDWASGAENHRVSGDQNAGADPFGDHNMIDDMLDQLGEARVRSGVPLAGPVTNGTPAGLSGHIGDDNEDTEQQEGEYLSDTVLSLMRNH